MVKVAVLGAGVIGLANAVKIKEKFKEFEVVILSSEFSPATTGDGSGGLWYPYLCGDTPEHLLGKWGSATYCLLHELWQKGGHNVCLLPIYNFYTNANEIRRPEWADEVFGYKTLSAKQIEYFNQYYSAKFVSGITFNTFVVHASSMLRYLSERFERAHGKVLRANITSLRDSCLNEYDVVVNCTGLGARDIVPDKTVFPIRGQISKVIAPWVNEVVIDEDGGNYIIPNTETCVLGGTHQEHDYNRQIDNNDTEFITNGCRSIMPGLKHASLVSHWAGLRPGRHEVRLEAEQKNGKLFIHNYGHGGSGLTLFWGCADEVLGLLKTNLKSNKIQMSKL